MHRGVPCRPSKSSSQLRYMMLVNAHNAPWALSTKMGLSSEEGASDGSQQLINTVALCRMPWFNPQKTYEQSTKFRRNRHNNRRQLSENLLALLQR